MKAVSYYKGIGIFWIRFFGYGFRIKNFKKCPLLFSERILRKGFKIIKWHLKIIKPSKFINDEYILYGYLTKDHSYIFDSPVIIKKIINE